MFLLIPTTPHNIQGVRGFSGACRLLLMFHQRFWNYQQAFNRLIKKDQWQWDIGATVAFDRQKNLLSTALVLALSNLDVPFVLECDASNFGIGAVLLE